MRVMALDTATREGSIALVIDDRVVDERRGDGSRTHTERLPGDMLALAAAHGLTLADVDLFAVAAGPGSFTGLRTGIATMQGFAFATGRPIVAVSTLEALASVGAAADGVTEQALMAAWMDAHRGDVFAALYRIAAAPAFTPERLVEVEGPTVGHPAVTLARWIESAIVAPERPVVFLGDGARIHADVIQRSGVVVDRGMTDPLLTPLLAGAIGRLAGARARRGETMAPGEAQALYVRKSLG